MVGSGESNNKISRLLENINNQKKHAKDLIQREDDEKQKQ
jgi:hypothetical protein